MKAKLSGIEWDAFHRYSRGILIWKRGEIAKIKARFSRRIRHKSKVETKGLARGE